MKELLFEKQLRWTAFDPSEVLPTLVSQILRERCDFLGVTHQFVATNSRAEEATDLRDVGLMLWRVQDHENLESTISAIQADRLKEPKPVCLVWLQPNLSHCSGILVEAGAQLVVTQLPSLQKGLEKILARSPLPIPLAEHGSHPLVSGIVERLPWPELAE
ncbi:MAG: hypothetical protein VXZ82_14670 [Planctomycetota bacterium]|nr:hypothetical protein [Planctomycetota bacterium]